MRSLGQSLAEDPQGWAQALGVSREAVEVYASSAVIDLHIDTFLWTRMLGYDPLVRHSSPIMGGPWLGHVDLPRLIEGGVTGAFWIVTTNPLRTGHGRLRAFERNVRHLSTLLASSPQVALCKTATDYVRARAKGRHAAFFGVQGANAFDTDPGVLDRLDPGSISLVTLMHLSSSSLGRTSSPLGLGARGGLTQRGLQTIEQLNARRIFVDLAHINAAGFWDAVKVHDSSLPLLVSHTGVSAVYPHWRNVDDQQLRAIADTGGLVGIMYHGPFLGPRRALRSSDPVVDHLEHVVRLVGEDHAALGSDWDGAIRPPPDLNSCLNLPRLVERMLKRGWSPTRIHKILGDNVLRALRQLRP